MSQSLGFWVKYVSVRFVWYMAIGKALAVSAKGHTISSLDTFLTQFQKITALIIFVEKRNQRFS